jgi:hypothetical protein
LQDSRAIYPETEERERERERKIVNRFEMEYQRETIYSVPASIQPM